MLLQMSWPQIVIGLLILLNLAASSARSRSMCKERAGMLIVFLVLDVAYAVGYAFVLHEGGFW